MEIFHFIMPAIISIHSCQLASLNFLGCCNGVIEIMLRNDHECYQDPRQVKTDNEKHFPSSHTEGLLPALLFLIVKYICDITGEYLLGWQDMRKDFKMV